MLMRYYYSFEGVVDSIHHHLGGYHLAHQLVLLQLMVWSIWSFPQPVNHRRHPSSASCCCPWQLLLPFVCRGRFEVALVPGISSKSAGIDFLPPLVLRNRCKLDTLSLNRSPSDRFHCGLPSKFCPY